MTTIRREIPREDRDSAIASLGRLLAHYLPGQPLEVVIRRRKATRSTAQNSALWGEDKGDFIWRPAPR